MTPHTFIAEICFISDDESDDKARNHLYKILNNPRMDLISASVEDIYEIENDEGV